LSLKNIITYPSASLKGKKNHYFQVKDSSYSLNHAKLLYLLMLRTKVNLTTLFWLWMWYITLLSNNPPLDLSFNIVEKEIWILVLILLFLTHSCQEKKIFFFYPLFLSKKCRASTNHLFISCRFNNRCN
jgi:hypothetical protein